MRSLFLNEKIKIKLISFYTPAALWSKVATDLFHSKDKHFVIVVDHTTKYFDLSEISNLTSRTVTLHKKTILSRYGIPKEIISDGAPEFTGKEY